MLKSMKKIENRFKTHKKSCQRVMTTEKQRKGGRQNRSESTS